MKKHGKPKFQRELSEATNEKDVENIWRSEIKKTLPKAKITSPHNTDGILVFDNIHTLLEFKDKKGFANKRVRCAVLMQALFYLHNIMEAKEKLPTTVFIGDSSECFFLNTNVLADYLNRRPDINWASPPSQAALHNTTVLNDMENDKKLDNTFIIDVQSETFRVKDIIPILDELTKNCGSKIKITDSNLLSAFQYFKDNVINTKQLTFETIDEKKRVSRLIDVFYNLLTDRKTTGKNLEGDITTHGEVIKIHKKQFDAFFNLFDRENYTIEDKKRLVSVKDQVLEEILRRRTGAYFTPDLWIKKAHEMVAEQFGADWKEKYVVWDCASGTSNLTHDYPFKELYNSTLEQGDVNTVNDMGYKGTNFQYDFLNEDEGKLPPSLYKTLTENKPILFLINPPYGTACTSSKSDHKSGIATNTLVNIDMKKKGIGACSEQLYAQFLFRILSIKTKYNLNVLCVCIFSPPLFMCGESYKKFRDIYYNHFDFKDGMLFKANQFADVSGDWGISFTIWEGKNDATKNL
jgi:hypothetical protein